MLRIMSRPDTLVLVVGTATDIGKTWVGGQVLAALRRRGVTVAARKPAQSYDPAETGPTDAEVLATATGETVTEVSPEHRAYPIAMAPPMAAAALGLPEPTTAELIEELHWPEPLPQIGWLETVGGPHSPIAVDGDAVTFAERLDPDLVVLVADAGLGTVNAVLSSIAPFDRWSVILVLNRFDPESDLHRRNREWLETRQSLEIVVDLEALSSRLASPGARTGQVG